MFYKYEVGSLLNEGITRYNEGLQFDFGGGGGELRLYYASPTSKEIQDVKKGTFSAGIVPMEECVFMLFRFGMGMWMDAPFTPHLMRDKNAEIGTLGEDMGYLLTIMMVDANTGILKVLRQIGLENEYSEELRRHLLSLKEKPFDKGKYDQFIRRVYVSYTTDQLLEMSTVRI